MKQNKCIICDSKNLLFILRKSKHNLFKCNKCGLIYVYPRPNLNQLVKDCYSQLGEKRKHKKIFSEILDRLDKFKIKDKMKCNLLDVGCSTGIFLSIAKERGFNVYGVEVNERTAEIANNNKLNVFVGVLKNANFKDNYFSIIHLGSVIEHVPDPVALLKESKRILKKGGIIIISTPNSECFWFKASRLLYQWFKFPWSVLIPHYHLFLFSESNFEKLLSRMKFKILDINYHKCSLRHQLGGTGLFKKLKKEKSIKILLYTLLVFSIYIFVYFIDYLITPFKNKDFSMIIYANHY